VSTALAEAIARLDVRFGARTVVAATTAADTARERRFLSGTSFDVISGGIQAGTAVSLTGKGTCGKVTLALHAVAGAQQAGGTALWVDPSRSFDPRAARRAGVDLRRVIVVRARTCDEVVLSAGAGLRSEGFRIVVADLGPSFAMIGSADGIAPVLPHVRGSTAALVVLSDHPARRVAMPTFVVERVDWERTCDRTLGWTLEARRLGGVRDEHAVLHVSALDGRLVDDGIHADLREEAV
jgi:predicted ATP-dependent serine protease